MADPLSMSGELMSTAQDSTCILMKLSGSIIAVLQLTATTLCTLYGYGNSVKNASKDKKRIVQQLMGLQKLLTDVQEVVENAGDASVRLSALKELVTSPQGFTRYHDEVNGLNTKLQTRPGRSDRLQALIWPLKAGEVKKTLEYLKEFQQLLDSTLSTAQL
jgi:hypothetical protein